jgi:hypothetical protein
MPPLYKAKEHTRGVAAEAERDPAAVVGLDTGNQWVTRKDALRKWPNSAYDLLQEINYVLEKARPGGEICS